MHELGIATNILDAVRAEAARRNGARVVKAGLRLGEFSGVDPESLSFCFESLVKGSDLEPLALEIEQVPLRNRCTHCDHEFNVVNYEITCPHCGALETRRTGEDELELAYLEIEEP